LVWRMGLAAGDLTLENNLEGVKGRVAAGRRVGVEDSDDFARVAHSAGLFMHLALAAVVPCLSPPILPSARPATSRHRALAHHQQASVTETGGAHVPTLGVAYPGCTRTPAGAARLAGLRAEISTASRPASSGRGLRAV